MTHALNQIKGKKRSTGIVGEQPADVESLFYNLGHDLAHNSLEFMAGVVVGGFKVVGKLGGKLLFGGMEALKNTRNLTVKNTTQAAIVNAAFAKMSPVAIDKLANGGRLDDRNISRIASFIDSIESNGLNNYDVKSDNSQINLGNYVFEKTKLKDANSYRIIDANNGEPILVFSVDLNGGVSVTPTKTGIENREKLTSFIDETADRFNLDLPSKELNEINDRNIQQVIIQIQTDLNSMSESIESIDSSIDDTRAQNRSDRERLLEQRSQLYQLEDRANIIQSIIVEQSIGLAEEIERNPDIVNRGRNLDLQLLISKLEGILESINVIEEKITKKETTLNNLDINETGTTIKERIAAEVIARAKVTARNSTQVRTEQSLLKSKNTLATSTVSISQSQIQGAVAGVAVATALTENKAAFDPYGMTFSEEIDYSIYEESLPSPTNSNSKTAVAVTPVPESESQSSSNSVSLAQ